MSDILVARGLNKRFGGVVAANDVNVRIARNDVVSLLGTNGAGKTTFVNMVTGYIRKEDLEHAENLGIHRLILKPNTV